MVTDNPLAIRIAAFLPLLYITWQVLQLRKILRSPAWSYLALGFVIFTVIRGVIVFWPMAPVLGLLIAAIVGYLVIAYALHRLRGDLLAALGRVRR